MTELVEVLYDSSTLEDFVKLKTQLSDGDTRHNGYVILIVS